VGTLKEENKGIKKEKQPIYQHHSKEKGKAYNQKKRRASGKKIYKRGKL